MNLPIHSVPPKINLDDWNQMVGQHNALSDLADATVDSVTDLAGSLAERLYPLAYSWEQVPGSAVTATTIGVLPKVGHTNAYNGDYYAGLVTVAAGSSIPGSWYLYPPTTETTVAAIDSPSATYLSGAGGVPAPAGVYLAVRYTSGSNPQPPLAFPAGWTPGNTTGAGPILPRVGSFTNVFESYFYAGLVDVAPNSPGPVDAGGVYVYLDPKDTPPSVAGDSAATSVYFNGQVPVAGTYMAFIIKPATQPAPTALPAGWTFRPYGIGPIAITDENAGGLIGDIAYVVSGYVANRTRPFPAALYLFAAGNQEQILTVPSGATYRAYQTRVAPREFHMLWTDGATIITCPPDTYVTYGNGYTVHTDAGGPIDSNTNQAGLAAQGFTEAEWPGPVVATPVYLSVASEAMNGDYCWPYLERFNLATKTWLPRIKLPDITPGNPYAAEGGFAGVIGGKLYFGGGDGAHITGKEFFVFDPATEQFTQLPDMPSLFPDYNPYGVIGSTLYYFESSSSPGQVHTYTPGPGATWQSTAYAGPRLDTNPPIGDEVQGFEISGRLWFVYDGAAFVFDPVALTVTAKATVGPFDYTSPASGQAYLLDGKIHTFRKPTVAGQPVNVGYVYDPVADTWTPRTDVTALAPSPYTSQYVGVTYNGIPFILSAFTGGGFSLVGGVYGLTGVALDVPRSARLQDVLDGPHNDTPWTPITSVPTGATVFLPIEYRRFRGEIYLRGGVYFPGAQQNTQRFLGNIIPAEFVPSSGLSFSVFAQNDNTIVPAVASVDYQGGVRVRVSGPVDAGDYYVFFAISWLPTEA